MAFPILSVGAEISSKVACGESLNATGPQSNQLLKRDAKHTLDMSQITKMMSEVSTAPPSPTMSFVRCISSECESAIDSPREEEESEHVVEKEGIPWTVTHGSPPSIEKLESSLTEMKALYKAKFGKDVDIEDGDTEESDLVVEEDGISWTVTRSAPPSIEKLESSLGRTSLEAICFSSLAEVKALYKAKFGKDVEVEEDSEESEHIVEEDSISWIVSRGAPPSIEKLESSLAEVKALYRAKFGKDVEVEDDSEESEHIVEEDGISWIVTRGAPPSIEKLESSLAEVKALYTAKFGKDVDGEYVVEKEGILWMETRGAPPSIEKLESSLTEVKALYKAKVGTDVEVEDSDSEGSLVDGNTWSALFQSMLSNVFGKM